MTSGGVTGIKGENHIVQTGTTYKDPRKGVADVKELPNCCT